MTNYKIGLVMTIMSLPGIYFLKPALKDMYLNLKKRISVDKKFPSENNFLLISSLQTLVIILVAIVVGLSVYDKTNLVPFLNESALTQFKSTIKDIIIISTLGAMAFLVLYYVIFKRWVNQSSIKNMEHLRLNLGLRARIFYGGIIEEIMCRWGLMSLLVWIGLTFAKLPISFIYWISILISGLLFGLGHLPAYYAAGCKKDMPFVIMVITLNLWAAIIFSWLFWQYGLLAAILAHIFFHLLWYPLDKIEQGKEIKC